MSDRIEKLIKIAKSLVGRPYKYGATIKEAPRFFDCSLFTQYVFQQIGAALPRTAIEQAMVGKKVAFSKITEGDIIFMKGEIGRYNKYFPQGVGHAGIYIGENKIIHAESKIGKVIIEDLNKFIKKKKPIIVIKRYV